MGQKGVGSLFSDRLPGMIFPGRMTGQGSIPENMNVEQ